MLSLLAVLLAAQMSKGPVVVGVTHDRAFVSWETSSLQINGSVSFGLTPSYGSTATDPRYTYRHFVQLSGLQPSTTYHYAVDSLPNEDSQFTTAPPPGTTAPFKFVVYGDNRTQLSPHQTVVNAIRAEPDVGFLVHTGDMIENTSAANPGWSEFFAIEHDLLRTKPFYPVIGNHETAADLLAGYAQFFAFPTFAYPTNTVKYYSVDWGNAHFVMLDTFESSFPSVQGFSDAQLEWMKADLDAARAAGKHLFAATHHGPYSHSKHGDNPMAQQKIVPELRARGVKAIFQGHDHVYERGCGAGLDYVIAGGGGAPLYAAESRGSEGGVVQKTVSDYSYLVVSVDGDKVTAQAKYVDGGVFDSFSLPSGCPGAPALDGGLPDGGADAGPDAGPDAGTPADGGTDPDPTGVAPGGGCSCGTGPGAAFSLLPLLAVALALRATRKARAQRP